MHALKATKRSPGRDSVVSLRREGKLPAILYGPEVEGSRPLQLEAGEFRKVFSEAGETTLLNLELGSKAYKVLVYETQKDPLSGEISHVDFYAPSMSEKVEATVPLVFHGVSPAVKELGGTLVRNISEVEVRALPNDLPHEIIVDVAGLKSFEDYIFVKDLPVSEKVELLRAPGDMVAHVVAPTDVEEELEKPIEEELEEIEVEGGKEEEVSEEAPTAGEEAGEESGEKEQQ